MAATEDREEGFYWVKYRGEWEAAEWVVDETVYWNVPSHDHLPSVADIDLDEIGPRIPRPAR